MSEHAAHRLHPRKLLVPMRGRSPDEEHRVSTPLELLFDLVFVVAVSRAAAELHHGIAEAHVAEVVLHFAMVFFAIWWAWMNFSWFASAYDTDDIPYRLTVFVQMAGALVIAAGVDQAFNDNYLIVTIGYLVMRLAGVMQWIRAAREDPLHRTTAYRYAVGVAVVQAAWLARLALPNSWQLPIFVMLALAEIAVPIWAERPNMTTWHPEHIAERYGLFTIIVLGESIASALLAIQSANETGDATGQLATIIIGGLLIVFAMWWLYFDQPAHELITPRTAFVWGYGHLLIFASAAAVGAGIAVAVDYAMHHAEISAFVAGASVAVPVALYLISLWFLHQRPRATNALQFWLTPLVALVVVLTPFTGEAVLATGLLLVALIAVKYTAVYKAAR